jgi:3-ketosteroid 9alpha-monooxygenase subunit A
MGMELPLTRTEDARFPFGIPNSWYVVAYSDELAAGALKSLRYFGEELILFRGEDGALGLLDAYCDHLGAHLGHGGKVVGNSVQCPFHNWRWDGDGRCGGIPYASQIPPNARIRHYPVQEHSGFIWAWYDVQGRAPAFSVPVVPQFGNAAWMPGWRRYEWRLKSHPQEIYENAIDYPHFPIIHGFEMPSGLIDRYENHEHIWGIDTASDAEGIVRQEGTVTGLGVAVLRYIGEFDTVIVVATTPTGPDEMHLRMAILGNTEYSDQQAMELKFPAYADGQAEALTQDFEIWTYKKYRAQPKLCNKDGPIGRYRQWASQFYG